MREFGLTVIMVACIGLSFYWPYQVIVFILWMILEQIAKFIKKQEKA